MRSVDPYKELGFIYMLEHWKATELVQCLPVNQNVDLGGNLVCPHHITELTVLRNFMSPAFSLKCTAFSAITGHPMEEI